MKSTHRWGGLVLLIACLQWTACRQVQEAAEDEEHGPAQVEHFENGDPSRVTLTEDAVKRLEIQTVGVQEENSGGTSHKTIPYAAVLYDIQGDTWTFTNPEPLVFVRHRITVDHIVGELAVLTDGPPSGCPVVTVGAAELYGSEFEFEEE